MSLVEFAGDSLRILDFDIEARPDAYLGGDLTTRSITAIAASWIGEDEVESTTLIAGGYPHMEQLRNMLEWFRALYDQADIVTGHNVVKYDLPVVSASMVYAGLDKLPPKRASDTLLHGPAAALAYSRSMENMAKMLCDDIDDKVHMSNADWKLVNTLDHHLVEGTRLRVTHDVVLHKALRAAMIERKILKQAKVWMP